jgi:hypothetical protein
MLQWVLPQKEKPGFVRKLSRKMKSLKSTTGGDHVDQQPALQREGRGSTKRGRNNFGELKFEVLDMTSDDVTSDIPIKRISYLAHLNIGKVAGGGSPC